MKIILTSLALAATLAVAPSHARSPAAHAVEMPEQLFGDWCEIFKRSTYDNRVLPERSNGWYVHRHLDRRFSEGTLSLDDECKKKDGHRYEISKDFFAACTPLHVSKTSVTGHVLEWTVKARCGGDGDSTFRATVKFRLKGSELTTYWRK